MKMIQITEREKRAENDDVKEGFKNGVRCRLVTRNQVWASPSNCFVSTLHWWWEPQNQSSLHIGGRATSIESEPMHRSQPLNIIIVESSQNYYGRYEEEETEEAPKKLHFAIDFNSSNHIDMLSFFSYSHQNSIQNSFSSSQTMNPNPNLAATFFVLVLTTLAHDNTNVVHASSVSSLFLSFRKLATHGYSKVSSSSPGPVRKLTQSSSASPAPAPAPAQGPAPGPTGGGFVNEDRCGNACEDQNLTACLQISTADPKEAFLFFKNDGEGPRKVNVRVPHSKITFSEIVPQHKTKKINVSAVVGATLSIVVNAGNRDCIIYTRSSIFKKLSIFGTQGTPVYGGYLLFLTVLIVGVTLACCCKSRKSRLQSNGVTYQELEMAKPETIAAEDLEKQEGWEDNWDDEWDESKAVKSPVARRQGNVSGNGLNSRSNDKKNWND